MIWVLFIILIFVLLALDLGVFHRGDEKITMKSSLIWTAVWVSLALIFGLVLYWMYDIRFLGLNQEGIDPFKAMIQFYTGYLIEESLSLDNIFVIALIFAYFRIEGRYQHRILFWGIIGAVFFRLIMIVLGTAFVQRFDWAMLVFGGILVYSAFKMMQSGEEDSDFKDSVAVRMLSKIYPIDWEDQSGRYFLRKNGKRVATSLFAALVVVEFSDILFAVDSIPAIFSITKDPFIVFTSNIFAILGLRNLFFFLAGMMDKFHYLKYSLVVILLFIGLKMILEFWYHGLITPGISLIVILSSLTLGIIYSLLISTEKE
ncbi:MAG: TerC family protein [Bacteroidetes bacterium]|nr:MAG: TerC family protein [Bacteroidota bacterium]